MDEDEFKQRLHRYNETPCVFSKAILFRCADCSYSQRLLIAEREAIACGSESGHRRCEELIPMLREKAQFALHLTQINGALPHNNEIRVQCGSLQGLQDQLSPQKDGSENKKIENIDQLLNQAIKAYQSNEQFPFSAMMQTIKHMPIKKRSKS